MIIIHNLLTVDLVQLVHAVCQIPSQRLFVFNLIKFTLKFDMYKFLSFISVSGDFNTVKIEINAHPY